MKIALVTPAGRGSRKGNRVTAERWSRLLDELGHDVEILERWSGEPAEVLIALHARRSAGSVERFRRKHPGSPRIVALTGTDLYRDLPESRKARSALEMAHFLVGLHDEMAKDLPPGVRSKVRVIRQSAEPPPADAAPRGEGEDRFDVCVLAHLRPVKDPLLAARAVRLLPASSRVRVAHAGEALDEHSGTEATLESESNPRYRWVGSLSRDRARALLARSRLLVITSRLEGGANVLSEAIVSRVPVLSTRIAGSKGILGEDYPGFFPVGDPRALADALLRAETDASFYRALADRCAAIRPTLTPERERNAWRALLDEAVRLARDC